MKFLNKILLTAIFVMATNSVNAAPILTDNVLNTSKSKQFAYCSTIFEFHSGMAFYGISQALAENPMDEAKLNYLATVFLGAEHSARLLKAAAIVKSNESDVNSLRESLESEIDSLNLNKPAEELAKMPLFTKLEPCFSLVPDAKSLLPDSVVESTLNEAKDDLDQLVNGTGQVPANSPDAF